MLKFKVIIRAGQGKNKVLKRPGNQRKDDVPGGNGVRTIWPSHYEGHKGKDSMSWSLKWRNFVR